MALTELSKQIASSRVGYSGIFFLVFVLLNLGVHLTYQRIGRISFSYLALSLPFVEYSRDLTGNAFLGLLTFAILCFAILLGVVRLFGTKLELLGWLLLVILLLAALPIFDYRRIFI